MTQGRPTTCPHPSRTSAGRPAPRHPGRGRGRHRGRRPGRGTADRRARPPGRSGDGPRPATASPTCPPRRPAVPRGSPCARSTPGEIGVLQCGAGAERHSSSTRSSQTRCRTRARPASASRRRPTVVRRSRTASASTASPPHRSVAAAARSMTACSRRWRGGPTFHRTWCSMPRERCTHDARQPHPGPVCRDHHVDRQPARVHHGLAAQRRRPEEQHRHPRALVPRGRPGVVDVHARMHPRPAPLPQQPLDVVVAPTRGQHLTTRDDTVLSLHEAPRDPRGERPPQTRSEQGRGGVACGQPTTVGSPASGAEEPTRCECQPTLESSVTSIFFSSPSRSTVRVTCRRAGGSGSPRSGSSRR